MCAFSFCVVLSLAIIPRLGINRGRSRFFALAAKEFIERHQNIELLEALNRASDDPSDPETQLINSMHAKHRDLVKDQWYYKS